MTLTPLRHHRSQSSAKSPIGLRKRPDLVFVKTEHKHDSAVVVKDPIAMKYHRLRDDEWFVLQRLCRGVSLESLRDQYQARFRPAKVTLSQLNDLLFRLHQLGLTVSDRAGQGDRLLEKRQSDRRRRITQQFSSILFLRFPGVDPEPLLRRLYPLVRPLVSAAGLAAMSLLAVVAILTLASNWDRFAAEFPSMQQWFQLRCVFTLAAVLGATKVLHELGHALVCKRFGGECHQIGPMLLVFTPALYCDTSDSWMLPNRFARAAVGLAGIGTEVLLASIATLLWASTGPSLIHSLAMNVMVVCSVSTVLFNANPLLRYDGYYVLSDLCDVPNLGQKSRELTSRLAAHVLCGVAAPDEQSIGRRERFWLVVYAVMATVYRWALTLLILWFLMLMLRPYRLESIGIVLCIVAAGGLLVSSFRGPVLFLRHPGKRRQIRMNRLIRSGLVIATLLVIASIPFPSGESADGRVVPREETPIYIATGGHLDDLVVSAGMSVDEGDLIATLSNPEVVHQFSKTEARVKSQRELVQTLKSSRLKLPDAANELPVAEAMLVELEQQLETHRRRRQALKIRSPAAGRLIAPPRRPATTDPASARATDLTLTRWSGDPTEPRNRGCYVEPGTELFTVIGADRWDAELVVSASQVQRIKVSNEVKLILESDPAHPLTGSVAEISSKQWTIDDNRQRRDDEQATRMETPTETSYVVRVELDTTDPIAKDALLTGADVSARITAEPISILGRTVRFLNRLLRFR
ncbi:HlyD family efflux transporter periplasmic adaptor subunit [Stieleria sp. ICT_E10.1]|uniref:HlyD family efflux transporter periplasmic adaptor subunit n=1 Tax=Stieleria sedimenti TaxID=2976331 RepID=UPI0021808E75|nr:HlyD family efflux transporter periplasmic adaptor subunit [Stieleria sedimenti]MCS7468783.1 HlyD family efflux transporter periplasmic adaptor subunit [Stieleria sedimenti]